MSEERNIVDSCAEYIDLRKVIKSQNDHEHVVIPEGFKIEHLDSPKDRPDLIEANVELLDAESFIKYVKDYGNAETTIFANPDKNTFTAIIDQHERATSGSPPAWWQKHQARYNCPLSRQWNTWTESNKKPMSQTEFAIWLEDHLDDVHEPSGAELLEIIMKFKLISKAQFGSSINLHNGEVQFSWSNEHEKGTIEIPETIKLGIPVYKNGDEYAVKCRFKYRVNDGSLKLWYEIIQLDEIRDHAFEDVSAKLKEELVKFHFLNGIA